MNQVEFDATMDALCPDPALEDLAAIRNTAQAIVAALPSGDARPVAAAVLRAYADAEHHFGEGIRQRVDYGTGVEYDAVCACGASWGEDGCTERERLLWAAAEVESPTPVDKAVDNEPPKPTCPRCGSDRWVSVSLDGGYTRRAQCVPCGTYHQPVIGPGWRSPRFGDVDAEHADYRSSV